jgi:hypothetical protein
MNCGRMPLWGLSLFPCAHEIVTDCPEQVQDPGRGRSRCWHGLTVHWFPRSLIRGQILACAIYGEGYDGRVSARLEHEHLHTPSMASGAQCR